MHRRRRNRPPRYGLHTMGHRGQIRSTQLRETREPRAESREPRAESREPRAESREPRAESREPRAESREPRAESREPRARPPGCREPEPRAYTNRRGAPCLSRCRSPRPPEFSPPLAGDPPCADESRAAHLPAASGEPFAGRPPGAPASPARARGPKRALPKRATRGRGGTSTGLRAFLTRLGVLLAISTAVARRHSGLAMRFPGRSQHTGGRWLAAMAAQWLVDGSNSTRRRRARAWPPQRAVGAKPPSSPERRERQETSSCRPGPGLPRLSGWERIQPFEFFSPGVGGKSLADKHLATCLPTASSERATELSADAVRPAELLPTPSRAVATRRAAITRRAIHSTGSGPVRAVSVVRRCIANLLLLGSGCDCGGAPLGSRGDAGEQQRAEHRQHLDDLEERNFAQAFTTGAGEFGYAVESVELNFQTLHPRAEQRLSASGRWPAGRRPRNWWTFRNPASFSGGRNTFTAPTGTSLDKQTTYFHSHHRSSGLLRGTSSNSEDSSGQSDWSIGNNGLEEIPDFNITWRASGTRSRWW